MLVLTRKSNQSIMIGDDVEVSVLSIMGEKVRLGISAPRDVPVFRKEVYLEIQDERGEVTAGGRREVDEELHRLGPRGPPGWRGRGRRGAPPARPHGPRGLAATRRPSLRPPPEAAVTPAAPARQP